MRKVNPRAEEASQTTTIGPEHRSTMTGYRYAGLKRVLDLLACVVALPLLVPILSLCALAIWIESPGASVIYVQERTGRDGVRFGMYKFRTMVPNAAALEDELRHLSIVPFPDFKLIDDPRVTRVGRFLRKSSLDELPQLLNVVRGEMSLVGPRPTPFPVRDYELWQTARLEVLPGLTGPWQVDGRNQMTFDERARSDIAYIRSMSLWRDVRLIIRTLGVVVRGTGE